MDFLRHLFTELSSEHGNYLITWMIGSFLIGWIANYFANRSKQKALTASLDTSKIELKRSKEQQQKLQGTFDLKEADFKKVSLELRDKNSLVSSLGVEKKQLDKRLKRALDDFEKTKVEHTQTTARLEELNDQILGLRTKNSQLGAEIQQSNQKINQYADTQSSLQEQQELQNIITRLQDENKLLKQGVKETNTTTSGSGTEEYKALETKIVELEADKEKLNSALAEITQLEEGNESLSNTLSTLIEENEAMAEKLEQLPQYEEGNAALNASILQLIEQNEVLKAQVEELNQYESGNDILNSTITQLIEENESLKLPPSVSIPEEATALAAVPQAMSAEDMDTEQAQAAIRSMIGTQLATASAGQKDDLKKINGIGPFIEEKLNSLGIYTYEQVSQLEGLIPTLTAAIEFFPGRIDRDEWVGQADRLAYMKKASTPNPSRRVVRSTTVRTRPAEESFITEKKAIQEKIIVDDSKVKSVPSAKSVRTITRKIVNKPVVPAATVTPVKKDPVEAASVALPDLPTVPPIEKVTPPPAPATPSLSETIIEKIEVPSIEEKAATDTTEKEVPAESPSEKDIEIVNMVSNKDMSIGEDDLKKIEGIGPKIAKVLFDAGIINYEQLAAKTKEQLQEILDDAGPRYRIARPNSWPMQAKMAAAGEWEDLKKIQDEMRGGIFPED